MWTLSVAIFVAVTISGFFCQEDGRCSSPDNDLGDCLAGIREAATDRRRFWFGAQALSVDCPARSFLNAQECGVSDLRSESIASLLFGPNETLSSLDRYLDMSFTSEPGSYTGCDTTYESTTVRNIRVNPLSMRAIKAWDARSRPTASYTSSEGEFFTLVTIRPSTRRILGLVLNIPGNDRDSGEISQSYRTPYNARRVDDPIVFLIYRQTGRVTLINGNGINEPFDLPTFATIHDLEGPVAMNWVLLGQDPYSIFHYREEFDNYYCASLFSQAYNDKRVLPFVPRYPQVYVSMSVRFVAPPVSLSCNGQTSSFDAVDVVIDPLGNQLYSAAIARRSDTKNIYVSMYLNTLTPGQSSNFEGRQFTLLMVDPDIPDTRIFRRTSASSIPQVHWLLVNIENGDIDQADEVLEYRRALPEARDTFPHTFYILLYEQTSPLDPEVPFNYSNDEDCPLAGLLDPRGRCFFDMDRFVSEQGLRLAGISWFTVTHDDYSRCAVETDQLAQAEGP